MTQQLVIQLIETTGDTFQFCWGMVDEIAQWPAGCESGDEQTLVAALADINRPALLLLPGSRVSSRFVPFEKKQAKHFAKMLPYEIEEEVLTTPESLHFSIGHKTEDQATIAYVDEQWFSDVMAWFDEQGISIERAVADYQILQAEANELILWLNRGYLWGKHASGLGFSVAQHLSQLFLKDYLSHQDEEFPESISVYAEDDTSRSLLESHILPPVEYSLTVGQPPLDFDSKNSFDFAAGGFGQSLPLNEWWQQSRAIIALAAVALVVFVASIGFEINKLQTQREATRQASIDAFRTVVPSGPTAGIVRRLQVMLREQSGGNTQSSDSVLLLSKLAPVLTELDIQLETLNYSLRDGGMRINIKASDFNGVETFRQKLKPSGVDAQLQGSNAVDDGFQARLRLVLAEAN